MTTVRHGATRAEPDANGAPRSNQTNGRPDGVERYRNDRDLHFENGEAERSAPRGPADVGFHAERMRERMMEKKQRRTQRMQALPKQRDAPARSLRTLAGTEPFVLILPCIA